MALTITNSNTLSLLNILNRTSANQSQTLTRLSTGIRVNSGKDDPAGLIAIRSLQSELTGVDASLVNNQRSDSLLGVAEGSLTQVADLLTQIESLSVASANQSGVSAAEIAANQEQVDQAITAIDRIIGSTEFNGKKLLDGSLGINVTGVNAANITDVRVSSKNPANSTTLNVNVTAAASQANFSLATTSATTATTITIQGKDGTANFDIAANEAFSSIVAKINAATAQTGVTASANGANLNLLSSDYGTDAFARVTVLSGDTTNILAGEDKGVDAVATVNGQSAAVDGLQVNFSGGGVAASFNLTTAYNQAGGATSFTVASGGATFQLGSNASSRSTLGISGLFSQQLGSAVNGVLSTLRGGGTNALATNANQAAIVARDAITQVSRVQGQVGGFRKFQVGAALTQQTTAKESLTSALSTIRDVDFAVETANLNKQNVLLQSSIQLLGLANQQSASILSLLR